MVEYEARVLEIDKEKLEEKLISLGAQKIADFDYKRRVYNFNPSTDKKWIRLRTDGNKTTLTIKEVKSQEIDGTEESEILVSDFEETNRMLNKLGYYAHTYQENKRTRYTLEGVEIDIDTWPYIPTYVEIEGKSVDEVKDTIKKLDLQDHIVTSNDVQEVFRKYYKIDIAKKENVKFGEELDKKYYIEEE
ncbi:MAG: CYTH domain-containing protein [Clostridia bacterium]|nr:CYTH domain-containing protein [Clostridia bacterium]